jgi:hypothetical protein
MKLKSCPDSIHGVQVILSLLDNVPLVSMFTSFGSSNMSPTSVSIANIRIFTCQFD